MSMLIPGDDRHHWKEGLASGAFARSDWSRLFQPSFINRLIRTHGVPLFVAHR